MYLCNLVFYFDQILDSIIQHVSSSNNVQKSISFFQISQLDYIDNRYSEQLIKKELKEITSRHIDIFSGIFQLCVSVEKSKH